MQHTIPNESRSFTFTPGHHGKTSDCWRISDCHQKCSVAFRQLVISVNSEANAKNVVKQKLNRAETIHVHSADDEAIWDLHQCCLQGVESESDVNRIQCWNLNIAAVITPFHDQSTTEDKTMLSVSRAAKTRPGITYKFEVPP